MSNLRWGDNLSRRRDRPSSSSGVAARYLQNKENAKLYLENEGQGQGVEERNLCHLTGNVRIHICAVIFFRVLATWNQMPDHIRPVDSW